VGQPTSTIPITPKDQLDSAPPRRWSQQLQNQLHVALSAKLREQGSNGILAEQPAASWG